MNFLLLFLLIFMYNIFDICVFYILCIYNLDLIGEMLLDLNVLKLIIVFFCEIINNLMIYNWFIYINYC